MKIRYWLRSEAYRMKELANKNNVLDRDEGHFAGAN